jgi:AcrR family transcriptional regulator
MADFPLTKEVILDTTEEVLRRYGPDKTTVKDVAKALGISHAAIYRYYTSKSELTDAVTERWLLRITEPLEAVIKEKAPAEELLLGILSGISKAKQQAALADPELFAAYTSLVEQSREVLQRHIGHIVGLLELAVAAGIESGSFAAGNPRHIAEGLFWATTRFHHPAFVKEWQEPDYANRFNSVWDLLLKGLAART